MQLVARSSTKHITLPKAENDVNMARQVVFINHLETRMAKQVVFNL